MGVKGCAKCLKVTMVVINALVMLAGAAAIGVGVWLMVSKYGPEKLKDVSFSKYLNGMNIAIMVGGSVIFILSFLGCCGALAENRGALATFGALMLLLLVVFVVAIILAYVFRNDLKKEFGKELTKSLKDKYEYDRKDAAWNKLWDFLQKELKCCGVEGDGRGDKSYLLWLQSSWKKINFDLKVPASCCDPKFDVPKCQKWVPTSPQTDHHEDNRGLYTTGCVDKLFEEIKKNIAVIGGVIGAVLFIILLSAIFSFVVCSSIDSPNYVA